MTHKTHEFFWNTSDGIKVYGHYWTPEGEIKGVISIVHGFGEHIHRYGPLADYLTKEGFALVGCDLRGHGRSGGKKGHTPSYDHLLNQIEDLLMKTEEYFPEIPRFLYGHSMGGNLVLNYLLERNSKLNGAVVTSPWLGLPKEPPKWQVLLGKMMLKIYPAWTDSAKMDASKISRIPEEVRKYETDPLIHDKITASLYFSVSEKAVSALEAEGLFQTPVLLLHGTADQLTSFDHTKRFAEKFKHTVTFIPFTGGYHELINDLERERVFGEIGNWLKKHL